MPRIKRGRNQYLRLGQAIAAARNRLGLTQAELADLAGVSPGYIGMVERGMRRPEPHVLKGWAQILRCPYQEFYEAAGYLDPELDVVIPPGVITIIRRMVKSGVTAEQFAAIERVTSGLFLQGGRDRNHYQGAADSPGDEGSDEGGEHRP